MCNKIGFSSAKAAMKYVRGLRSNRARSGIGARHLRAYPCGRCGEFHLTCTSKTEHRRKMAQHRGARA